MPPDVGRHIVEGDQRHSSTPQHRKGRGQSPPSSTRAVDDRAKARGLGTSAREARGDVGDAPDVAGSQSPTSPAACERRRNNAARGADRTAVGARSPGLRGRRESRPVGRPRCARRALRYLPANGRLIRRCAEVRTYGLVSACIAQSAARYLWVPLKRTYCERRTNSVHPDPAYSYGINRPVIRSEQ